LAEAAQGPQAVRPAFPISATRNQRRLRDAKGRAVFINGEAAWSLITGLDEQEAELYLDDRAKRGFNAIILNIIEHKFNGPTNQYGQVPFSKPGDLSTPNDEYFKHVDWVIDRARDKGMLVFATPAYFGYRGGDEGWYQEVTHTSLPTLRGYGRYLGRRYKRFDNIVWVMGGDYGSAAALPYTRAIVQGLQETDRPRVFTAHNERYESGVKYHEAESWLSLNTTYADCEAAAEKSLEDYMRKPVLPFVFFEGRYENEGASDVCLRSQAYWSVLAGSNGHFLGIKPVWGFESDWKDRLNSSGSRSMTYFGRLFLSRPWQKLTPDLSSRLLTGGRGADTDVAGAAITTDRTTAIIYTPSPRRLTVNMSRIAGPTARAWWFNPKSGRASRIGDFPTARTHTFTPRGSGDWVLVIDAARLKLRPPGT
jgi:hypothetical protein